MYVSATYVHCVCLPFHPRRAVYLRYNAQVDAHKAYNIYIEMHSAAGTFKRKDGI